jgi:aryl-alcohol dehydrogenase-like predicted oxidoreductase
MMEYRRLGRTGLKVSTICLGTMQFGWTANEEQSFQVMDRAIELGCNFFDTADVYSRWYEGNEGGESETIIGNWLAEGRVRREDLILATKVRGKMGDGPNNQGLSRHHILHAVEESLDRLQTDYIDLYQVHSPDRETPLEETLQALDDLVIRDAKTCESRLRAHIVSPVVN